MEGSLAITTRDIPFILPENLGSLSLVHFGGD